jgi:hypothetical protein
LPADGVDEADEEEDDEADEEGEGDLAPSPL